MPETSPHLPREPILKELHTVSCAYKPITNTFQKRGRATENWNGAIWSRSQVPSVRLPGEPGKPTPGQVRENCAFSIGRN